MLFVFYAASFLSFATTVTILRFQGVYKCDIELKWVNETKFHKAKRKSLGSYQTESAYYSLTCFVLFSVLYTLLESSN